MPAVGAVRANHAVIHRRKEIFQLNKATIFTDAVARSLARVETGYCELDCAVGQPALSSDCRECKWR